MKSCPSGRRKADLGASRYVVVLIYDTGSPANLLGVWLSAGLSSAEIFSSKNTAHPSRARPSR